MYVYYMLSAIPSMQKYLWWKRYLTIMQIVSLLFVFNFPVMDRLMIFLITVINFYLNFFFSSLVMNRFNSLSFSVIQFKFSFNRTAIFQSSSERFYHSMLACSPTCSHLSTSNHTIKLLKSLKMLSKRRRCYTMKMATSFQMVKRSLKLNKNNVRLWFHVLSFPSFFNHIYSYAISIVSLTSDERILVFFY